MNEITALAPPPSRLKMLRGGMKLTSYNPYRVNALVVEKIGLSQQMVRGILLNLGVGDLRITADPKKALEMIQQDLPDLIFSDWSPGLNGIDFLMAVRNGTNSPNPFTPFVMVTANCSTRNVCKARDAGTSEFLAKPFTAKLIYARICSVIERRQMFISNPSYFGPNRRRKSVSFDGRDRRRGLQLEVEDRRERQRSHDWPGFHASFPSHNSAGPRRFRRSREGT